MKSLFFTHHKPAALLCLNGELPAISFFSHFPDTPIFAADGAANSLLSMNIMPNSIIGDLDSFSALLLPSDHSATLVYRPSQDTNDFEKCLVYLLESGLDDILIAGIHGGDMEHSLNNLSVLWKFYGKFRHLVLADASGRLALPVDFSFCYTSGLPGELISLIPCHSACLTTQGFVWELNNEVLESGFREGARNRIALAAPSITMHQGKLLFFCQNVFPLYPVFH
jgi:thiamine pyrophosphokinase